MTLITAAILFAVAAVLGATMAVTRLRGRERPHTALAVLHGLFAATGLVVLLVVLVTGEAATLATIALVIFVAAALGGFYLVSFHLRGRALPVPFVFGHGLVAVVAFVLLLVAIAA